MSNEDLVVLAAVSAAEATVIMRRTHVDIVVCDQRMPGMTGLDFLSRLRDEFPHIRAVLLSGHVGDLPIARRIAQEIGVYCLLNKPCSATQLSLTIKKALECV